ncbi:hypothetical protein CCACVL1_05487 [Corchorus capsularis]|uniref:Uncharacterized protein n=1 Tax=Corchorus capsularis TaxID=210143 RepID=A0A1R3JKC2_COCAP|nr:hypothetical protein CCACVL1_05487 [Corchorus capsularis]
MGEYSRCPHFNFKFTAPYIPTISKYRNPSTPFIFLFLFGDYHFFLDSSISIVLKGHFKAALSSNLFSKKGTKTRGRGKRHFVHKIRDKGNSTSTVQVDTHDDANLPVENPSNDASSSDVPTMNHPTVEIESRREENSPVERVETNAVHKAHESATTEKRKTRGHNLGRSVPSDPSQRLKLTVIDGSNKSKYV